MASTCWLHLVLALELQVGAAVTVRADGAGYRRVGARLEVCRRRRCGAGCSGWRRVWIRRGCTWCRLLFVLVSM